MTKSVVKLEDKFTQPDGQVLLTSLQAVVRLLLDQCRRDRLAGRVTAGYVTGYRGSPITTLDAQLWAAEKLLTAHDIRFEPGLNEELAATSLRGTQQLDWFGKPRVEGVYALWYGKGIGVDRAHEALKLANLEGTSRSGGVLVMAGDDHAAKSSASAHQSDQNLAAAMIPTLYPATTEEILLYGQFGWAMSRFSGLYCGFKTITDTLDLTATVTLPAIDFPIAVPHWSGAPLWLRAGMPALEAEALTVDQRLPAAQLFVRENALDRVTHGGDDNRLTIVTAGKAWLDVCQALHDLQLTEERCRKFGLRVAKLALTWPVEPQFARHACTGAREVLVVEEKRAFIEDQLARLLYAMNERPALSGKATPEGEPLLSASNVLDAGMVRRALFARMVAAGQVDEELTARAAYLADRDRRANGIVPEAVRPAYFCSGCPHNTSTVVPAGSGAMGATGCHGLAHYMPGRNTMQTIGMGSEGMPWIAAQSFVDTPHYFQNLGDGTYAHSGLLAIRASVAAKSRVTYKILYNDAVAMTGGQPAEGSLTPEQIVRELVIEGVNPVALVSVDPDRFAGSKLPDGVRIYHRDELDQVQRNLRELPGTSAIVYEQTCANESRRRRKRGEAPDPAERLYINQAVCEGCGDCSVQSNCLSIEPVETEFGRKRQINQSSCNKDFSCIKGFCPSFVTVVNGKPAKRAVDFAPLEAKLATLPPPSIADSSGGYDMLVTGIGGTGVLTVGAVLAMAAHIEGNAAKVLDMTGMAQKGGAVLSHVRIAEDVDAVPSARVGLGQADLIVACDLVVATSPDVLRTAGPGTRLIANDSVVPTGEFQTDQAMDLSSFRFLSALGKRIDALHTECVAAGELATRLLGDAIFTNFLMVGFAAQKGLLPVSLAAIEQALRLNGVAVQANLHAVALGRIAAHDPSFLNDFAAGGLVRVNKPVDYETMLASRTAHLTAYQDSAWAERYLAAMARINQAVQLAPVADGGEFLIAAAEQLARLMSYKDEYEVARLYSRPEFAASIAENFDGNPDLELNLAPPFLPLGLDKKTGRPRKIAVGAWIFPVFGMLAKGKRLRHGPFDVFGYSAERRMERALIGEYSDMILRVAARLSDANRRLAAEIANSAALVRGYGPLKHDGVIAWRSKVAELMSRYEAVPATGGVSGGRENSKPVAAPPTIELIERIEP